MGSVKKTLWEKLNIKDNTDAKFFSDTIMLYIGERGRNWERYKGLLRLVCLGLTQSEIARELNRSATRISQMAENLRRLFCFCFRKFYFTYIEPIKQGKMESV